MPHAIFQPSCDDVHGARGQMATRIVLLFVIFVFTLRSLAKWNNSFSCVPETLNVYRKAHQQLQHELDRCTRDRKGLLQQVLCVLLIIPKPCAPPPPLWEHCTCMGGPLKRMNMKSHLGQGAGGIPGSGSFFLPLPGGVGVVCYQFTKLPSRNVGTTPGHVCCGWGFRSR